MKLYIYNGPNYGWIHLVNSYKKIVNTKSVVLEIGASTETNTREFAKYAKKIIGVEYYQNRLPQNQDNIVYRLGDWQSLTKIIDLNSIDCAVSSHCLEHIPNDLKALNELYQVLKPGGVALLLTPNRHRLARRLVELFTGPRIFPYWEHVREYSHQDLIQLIYKTKFSRYKITPVVFGIHAHPHWIFYSTKVPKILENYSNYWEIMLYKQYV